MGVNVLTQESERFRPVEQHAVFEDSEKAQIYGCLTEFTGVSVEVHPTRNFSEAAERVDSIKPHIVLTDIDGVLISLINTIRGFVDPSIDPINEENLKILDGLSNRYPLAIVTNRDDLSLFQQIICNSHKFLDDLYRTIDRFSLRIPIFKGLKRNFPKAGRSNAYMFLRWFLEESVSKKFPEPEIQAKTVKDPQLATMEEDDITYCQPDVEYSEPQVEYIEADTTKSMNIAFLYDQLTPLEKARHVPVIGKVIIRLTNEGYFIRQIVRMIKEFRPDIKINVIAMPVMVGK